MDKSTLQIVLSAKDEISKELKKVTKELNSVQKEIKTLKTASSQGGKGVVSDLKKIDEQALITKGNFAKLIGTFKGLGALRLAGALGALYGVNRALNLVRDSLFTASEFEATFSNINTLFSDTGESVKALETGIRDMVKTVPVNATELGSAAYQIVSAGISDAGEALKVLEASAKLAVAGLATTAEGADLLTSAVNSFKSEGLSANQISDILFKTVKAGKTTVSELAQAFGSTAPIIAEIGIGLADFSAATAALTTTGLPASQAQNALRASITSLLKPTKEMEDLFKSLGVKDGRELIATTGSLGEAFNSLKAASDLNNISLADAFGSVEGLTAILGVTGSVSESYVSTLKAMTDGVSILDEAFLKQQETMTAQWQLVKNQLNIAMVDLGSKIFPLIIDSVNQTIEIITSLSNWYKRHSDVIQAVVVPAIFGLVTALVAVKTQMILIAGLSGFTAMIKSLSGLAITATFAVTNFSFALGVLRTTMFSLTGVIAPLIALVAGLGFAINNAGKQAGKAWDDAAQASQNASDTNLELVKRARGIETDLAQATAKEVIEFREAQAAKYRSIVKGETGEEYKAIKDRADAAQSALNKNKNALDEYNRLKTQALGGNSSIPEAPKIPPIVLPKIDKESKKTVEDFGKEVEKAIETLQDFSDQQEKTSKEGSDALKKLRVDYKSNIKDIDSSIQSVIGKMSELRKSFEDEKSNDRLGVGEAFAEAEQNIKSLKNELARATDVQQIFDIKTQIREQEDALSRSKDAQVQFSTEIEEARRRAGLSDIERAVEDFNIKRTIAEQEFTESMSRLESERQALRDKRAEEKELYKQKVEEQRAETADKLANIDKEKMAFLKKLAEEILLSAEKEAQLSQIIADANAERMAISKLTHDQEKKLIADEIAAYQRLERQILSAVSARSQLVSSSSSRGSRDTGGPIQQTGLYRLHQGEYVVNRHEAKSGVGGGMVVNINGGTYLSESAAEKIGDMIMDKLKTNIRI